MKLLFVSDLHGATPCLDKFLEAMAQPDAPDIGIIGGDVTGMDIYPVVAQDDGSYRTPHGILPDKAAVDEYTAARNREGYYCFLTTEDELALMRADPALRTALEDELVGARLRGWLARAEKVAQETGRRILIGTGNHDGTIVDKTVRKSARLVELAEDNVIDLGDGVSFVSVGHTNPTPHKSTPREEPEDDLSRRIDSVVARAPSMLTAIFNFHNPPFDSGLDLVRKPDKPVRPVGSTAVQAAIDHYHPLLTLHGHIHESPGIRRDGRTVSINPGSMSHIGELHAVRVEIAGGQIVSAQLTIEHGDHFEKMDNTPLTPPPRGPRVQW